jgi:hypothetical protein
VTFAGEGVEDVSEEDCLCGPIRQGAVQLAGSGAVTGKGGHEDRQPPQRKTSPPKVEEVGAVAVDEEVGL